MGFRLIPKDESFFDLFEQQAAILLEASGVLVEATERFETLAANAKRLERLEHDGDQLTHELMAKLNRTFITPFDREDIHQLVAALDDVLDLMEAVTERFILFKVQQIMAPAKEIAKVIQQQAQEIHRVIPKLRHMRHEQIMPHCIEINRLENVGDRLLRDAFAALFDGSPDPIAVIKWRELYELLETATDKGEDVANTIEGIVLKNA
ncbi:MAG: phosphate transport regulator [Omnitrophica WOR_2 bacterium RIFCSPLOWO2_02_FULL_63_16]|nr:MAG: phosphate transport regulator [Omnitrophica WOR_2 bacterium GWA2_63_20]OGX18236.1 MAG: phosphate transport regulator [Omnitrophica WOR_2 bacterium GWF2_63_9]OGX30718.1 MAG: phosphate transport regulator [Omnitrophica WOR_2 bacterium RIFCSPHIGHO2_12_FULL_64_13]OGX35015.1 MAG: phosphate transport regulator [Omnitrophica WOR_2 bacterium RIFCSPHIGHO2_02_FULL_63_39]OGX44982.1 MAG: phosphate transport regulator [Omnitrophica WOR_2 bacterium RIFCSPLOWO2_02_FULL_63_16]OGX49624.1 MAG: phosphate